MFWPDRKFSRRAPGLPISKPGIFLLHHRRQSIGEYGIGLSAGGINPGKTDEQPIASQPDIFLFDRVNYDYEKKIFASFSMRADRSTKFRYENGLLVFPSGSVAWRFTQENFMGKLSWLSDK